MGHKAMKFTMKLNLKNYPKTGMNKGTLHAVLMSLAYYHNEQTGQCNPSIRTLADNANMTPLSIRRRINELERMGIISVERGSGTRSNQFSILMKAHEIKLAKGFRSLEDHDAICAVSEHCKPAEAPIDATEESEI